MAGTPRKAATMGVDRNGGVVGGQNQGSMPARQTANPSDDGEKDYVRKPTSLGPTNLPLRRTDDGNVSGDSDGSDTSTSE